MVQLVLNLPVLLVGESAVLVSQGSNSQSVWFDIHSLSIKTVQEPQGTSALLQPAIVVTIEMVVSSFSIISIWLSS